MSEKVIYNNVRQQLEQMISSDRYLFHATGEDGYKNIMESGYIAPLTLDGTRQFYKLVPRGTEKGTASFTTDPITLYEDDQVECFTEKNIIMVFDRAELVRRGVGPVKYIPVEAFIHQYTDLMTAPEENQDENEWRSTEAISISGALICVFLAPERVYDIESNMLRFPY